MNLLSRNNLFLLSVALLVFFGLAMLSTASAVLAYNKTGDSYFFVKRQLTHGFIPGLIFFLIASRFPYHKLKKLALPMMIISIFFLFLIFIPQFGVITKGAARWINIFGFSFQPSEILKLSFVLYLAALFETKQDNLQNFKEGLLPFLALLSVVTLLLISQPDLGTLSVIISSALAVYFVAGAKKTHMFLATVIGLLGVIIFVFFHGYGMERIQVYLNSNTDRLGSGYQLNTALSSISAGGLKGLGYGKSQQKSGIYLPEPMGDSISAILAEELGFIGVSAAIFLFIFFGWQGLRIAKSCPDLFGSLTTIGLTFWVLIQAFINIGAMTGVLPLTGLPLPFVSYGGTSMAVLLTACGIMYNIQKASLT